MSFYGPFVREDCEDKLFALFQADTELSVLGVEYHFDEPVLYLRISHHSQALYMSGFFEPCKPSGVEFRGDRWILK